MLCQNYLSAENDKFCPNHSEEDTTYLCLVQEGLSNGLSFLYKGMKVESEGIIVFNCVEYLFANYFFSQKV